MSLWACSFTRCSTEENEGCLYVEKSKSVSVWHGKVQINMHNHDLGIPSDSLRVWKSKTYETAQLVIQCELNLINWARDKWL